MPEDFRFWFVFSDTSIVESIHLAHVGAGVWCFSRSFRSPYYFAPGQPELARILWGPWFLSCRYLSSCTICRRIQKWILLRLLFNVLPVILRWWDSRIVRLMPFISSPWCMPWRTDRISPCWWDRRKLRQSVCYWVDMGVSTEVPICSRTYVDLYHAAVARDMETVSRLQPLVMQISSSIYTVGSMAPVIWRKLKCALSLLGVCDDFVAAPFPSLQCSEREKDTQGVGGTPLSGIETLNARSVCISLI